MSALAVVAVIAVGIANLAVLWFWCGPCHRPPFTELMRFPGNHAARRAWRRKLRALSIEERCHFDPTAARSRVVASTAKE